MTQRRLRRHLTGLGTRWYVALCLAVTALAAAPARAQADNAAEPWIDLELRAIAAHSTNPPRAARALADLSVAMDLAARAGGGQADEAVAAAGSTVQRSAHRAAGRRLAHLASARRRGVASRASAGTRECAGRGPDIRTVYDVSRTLTDEQRAIADRWADGAGTETPPGHWDQIALELIDQAGWGTVRAAHALSLLNTAQADAFIACWDARYAYWRERPVTAIRRELDPAWLPYLFTPPHPGYPSGHATTSGAAATVLGALFASEAARLRAWAEEAAVSRIYAGIHFPSDNAVGLALGHAVGQAALHRSGDGASRSLRAARTRPSKAR